MCMLPILIHLIRKTLLLLFLVSIRGIPGVFDEIHNLNKEDGYENAHTVAGGVRLFEEAFNKLNQDLIVYIKAT